MNLGAINALLMGHNQANIVAAMRNVKVKDSSLTFRFFQAFSSLFQQSLMNNRMPHKTTVFEKLDGTALHFLDKSGEFGYRRLYFLSCDRLAQFLQIPHHFGPFLALGGADPF